MRILSVDYGKKRTGLAVTDPLQIVAGGLVTVATSDLMRFITEYCQKEEVETIVFGEPTQPNGKPSENLNRVRTFVGQLRKKMPDMNIEWYDERFTSVLAHRTMIDAGLRRKARQNKELVDEISATIILQDYLEARKNTIRPT
ncbi:MAG: Holliday junction resolvase RuvX [Prevotella sp.]